MTEEGFKKAQSDNLPLVDSLMVAAFLKNSDCFVAAEIRGAKANSASRESYGDSAIGYVQVKHHEGKCIVKCKLCPEHRVRSKQYSVTLVVDEDSHKVDSVECQDCAAASGGCKHAIAFLMWVHRRSEEKSTTSVKCYWKRSELASIGSTKKFITSMELGKKRKHSEINTVNDASFLDEVVRKGKELKVDNQLQRYFTSRGDIYELSLHTIMQKFVEDGGKDYEDFIMFAKQKMPQEIISKAVTATVKQSSDSVWHELRYMRITASKIYEAAHCKTPYGTFVERLIGAAKIKSTQAMKRGCNLEANVLCAIEKKLSVKLSRTGLILNAEFPIMGASPDAIGPDFIVEIKCPINVDTVKNYIKENKPIEKYMAQMQFQMHF